MLHLRTTVETRRRSFITQSTSPRIEGTTLDPASYEVLNYEPKLPHQLLDIMYLVKTYHPDQCRHLDTTATHHDNSHRYVH